jgi:hypothetical protein
VLVVGVVAAGTAGLMAAVVPLDRKVLAVILLLAQLGFVTAWAYLLDTPGIVGAVAVSAGAAAASDGVLLSSNHVSLTNFASILALAFLLSLIWQILRPHRTRVTESLAATMAASVLAVAGGAYLTLRAGIGGQQAATAGLLGVAAVLGIGRLVDALVPRPALSGSRRRGLPGLVVGLASAGLLGAYYGSHGGPLTSGKAALVALGAAVVAAVTDLGIDAGLATLGGDPPPGAASVGTTGPVPPRKRAPWPARLVVLAVLPVLISAPPAYAIARAVLT